MCQHVVRKETEFRNSEVVVTSFWWTLKTGRPCQETLPCATPSREGGGGGLQHAFIAGYERSYKCQGQTGHAPLTARTRNKGSASHPPAASSAAS